MSNNEQELYTSPQVKVVEIKVRQIVCVSDQNAGNDGYGSNDYPW